VLPFAEIVYGADRSADIFRIHIGVGAGTQMANASTPSVPFEVFISYEDDFHHPLIAFTIFAFSL
jgi:hypothetical protein